MANKYRLMFLNILIVFISQDIVFSGCQGYEGYIKDCTIKGQCSVEEIKFEILNMIDHLANNINIYEVQNKIIGLIQLIQITTSAQLESSSDTIDNMRSIVYASIVLNQTQNVGNCFDGKEEELDALDTQISCDRTECISVYHDFGLNWLYYANITVSNIRTNITGLSAILSKCLLQNNNVTDCLWNLFETIQDLSTDLPERITNISNNAGQISDEVQGNITNCVSVSFASSIISFIDIVLEISQCVHANSISCNNSQKSCLWQNADLDIPDCSELFDVVLNISNGIDQINKQLSSIDDKINQQLANGKLLVTKLISDTASVIKSTIDRNNFNPFILKCIQNATCGTSQMTNSIINTLKQCQISITQSKVKLIKSRLSAFTNNVKKVTNIFMQLKGCMYDVHCIISVINNIIGILNTGSPISRILYEVTELVLSIKRDLESCTTSIVNSTTQFTSCSINLVTNCIGDITKIGNIASIADLIRIKL